jgi:hypothetical protein
MNNTNIHNRFLRTFIYKITLSITKMDTIQLIDKLGVFICVELCVNCIIRPEKSVFFDTLISRE